MKLKFMPGIIFITQFLFMQNTFARELNELQSRIQLKSEIQSKSQNEKKYEYRLSIGQNKKESEDSSAQITKTQIDFKLFFPMNKNLKFDFEPGFQFNTGSQQGIYSAEKPTSKIIFSNAQLTLNAFDYGIATAGAINQEQFHNSLLVDHEALPSLAIGIQDSQKNSILLTSTQLEFISRTNIYGEFQKNPVLNSLCFRYQPIKYLKLSAGLFTIENSQNLLSGNVQQTGNNFIQVSEGVYQLTNQFSGSEFQAVITTADIHRFQFELSLEALNNQLADTRENSSYLVGAQLMFGLSDTANIKFKTNYYELEPEATIGQLINQRGSGNRIGLDQNLIYESKQLGLVLSIGTRELIPMYNQTLQTSEKELTFKVETLYVEI